MLQKAKLWLLIGAGLKVGRIETVMVILHLKALKKLFVNMHVLLRILSLNMDMMVLILTLSRIILSQEIFEAILIVCTFSLMNYRKTLVLTQAQDVCLSLRGNHRP